MERNNNHYQVSAFAFYMANAWCKEEAERIFGEIMGSHFWNKYVGLCEQWKSSDAASMKLYFEMAGHYRDNLVSAAIDRYKDGSWIDGQ